MACLFVEHRTTLEDVEEGDRVRFKTWPYRYRVKEVRVKEVIDESCTLEKREVGLPPQTPCTIAEEE